MGKMERQGESERRDWLSVARTSNFDSRQVLEMLSALFQAHSDALFLKDREGKYILVNQAGAELVDRPVEEILGLTDGAIFDEESAEVVRARDRLVLETGSATTEEEVLTAAGVTRIYEATKAPFFDGSGNLAGVIGISRDVTARKEAEEALARSEHLLSLVLQTLPVAVQVMDLEGNIVLYNPACTGIWGKVIEGGKERYASVEAYWHDTQDQIQPCEWASWTALTEGEPVMEQLVDIKNFEGKTRTILNSAVPIEDKGKVIGAVVINEDITERRRLEKRMGQSQKMEAVGLLAGGVAHDFNNILTVISGCAELLLQDIGAEHQELVREILSSAQLGSGLTKQLLSFSRQSVLRPRAVDLNETVLASQRMLRRLIEENIDLSLDLDPRVGVVKLDPTEFDLMLMNLVVNARDAMPGGGEIVISTSRRLAPEGFVSISIKDTGEGIPPQIRDLIFDPFFTTKETGQGTGLGLATVYGIVQQSGGRLEVESSPGEGATFTVFLPRADVSGLELSPSATGESSYQGHETVLLVEDQATVRRLLTRALKRAGYQVVQAANGLEALNSWSSDKIDLLVTDVVMPVMGGFSLVEKLRESEPDIKVIFLSGYASERSLLEEFDSPRIKYMQKPVLLVDFLIEVRHSLDQAD
jgi:PAS domain S-box-containing protein